MAVHGHLLAGVQGEGVIPGAGRVEATPLAPRETPASGGLTSGGVQAILNRCELAVKAVRAESMIGLVARRLRATWEARALPA
jgi:hypothetical protein